MGRQPQTASIRASFHVNCCYEEVSSFFPLSETQFPVLPIIYALYV